MEVERRAGKAAAAAAEAAIPTRPHVVRPRALLPGTAPSSVGDAASDLGSPHGITQEYPEGIDAGERLMLARAVYE